MFKAAEEKIRTLRDGAAAVCANTKNNLGALWKKAAAICADDDFDISERTKANLYWALLSTAAVVIGSYVIADGFTASQLLTDDNQRKCLPGVIIPRPLESVMACGRFIAPAASSQLRK